jgi:hypothetical protein
MSFLGMRGTGDWVTDQRPKSWREQILYLEPNGMTPLNAILSKMASEKVTDPEFYWWEYQVGSVNGAVTGIFTIADMSVAYVGGAVAGDTLYFRVAAALAQGMHKGHQVLLRDTTDYSVDVTGKVNLIDVNGVNSIIGVKLLEPDDNSILPIPHDLSNCDHILVMGSVNPEGGEMPDAVLWDPEKIYNKTQIFRTSLSITRTARLTKLRTGDEYQKQKKECLMQHSMEMELAFLWSQISERIGENGKPERTMRGLVPFIRTFAPNNVGDYSRDPLYAGQTWLQGGEQYLDTRLEQMFRFGSQDKFCFAGSGAILGINRLVKASGQFQFTSSTKAYGIKVLEWVTPFGSITMKTHPLFSYDVTTRNMLVLFEPKNLKYRYITDTTFYKDGEAQHPGRGGGRLDATDEEYLTECSLEMKFPRTCAIINGVGLDSVV